MRFEKLHDVRVFFGGTLEPGKRLLLVAQSQVGVKKRGRRDVTGFSPAVKFVENPQRFRTAAGTCVGMHEHPEDSRAAVREGSGPLQRCDRFVEMFGRDEHKTEKTNSHPILRFDGKRGMPFTDCLIAAVTMTENLYYLSAATFLLV